MTGDCHVRFCEQLGVKLPRLTRLSDTTRGAEASAKLYSLVESARLNGHSPYAYLKHVYTELAKLRDGDEKVELESLLPWAVSLPQS